MIVFFVFVFRVAIAVAVIGLCYHVVKVGIEEKE
jgi:hypothetical protein